MWKVITLSAMAMILVVAGLVAARREQSVHICLLCRLERVHVTTIGSGSERSDSNAMTDWYQKEMPHHEHVWRPYHTEVSTPVSREFYCGRHPVFHIHPETQRRFLEDATEAERAKFFSDILSDDPQVQAAAVDAAETRGRALELKDAGR